MSTIINLPAQGERPAHYTLAQLSNKQVFKKEQLKALAVSWGVKRLNDEPISRLNVDPLREAILLAQKMALGEVPLAQDMKKETKATLLAKIKEANPHAKASLSLSKDALLKMLENPGDEKDQEAQDRDDFEHDRRSMTIDRLKKLIKKQDPTAEFASNTRRPALMALVQELYGWDEPVKEVKPIKEKAAIGWIEWLKTQGRSAADFGPNSKLSKDDRDALMALYVFQKSAPKKEGEQPSEQKQD